MKTPEAAPDYTGYRFPPAHHQPRGMVLFSFLTQFSVRWKSFWPSVVSSSRTKRCDSGASHSGKPTPTNCVVAVLAAATHGIRTRVFLTIRGERHYLWRAVDQDGNVLDILVHSRRNKQVAKRFFRKLRKRTPIRSPSHHH